MSSQFCPDGVTNHSYYLDNYRLFCLLVCQSLPDIYDTLACDLTIKVHQLFQNIMCDIEIEFAGILQNAKFTVFKHVLWIYKRCFSETNILLVLRYHHFDETCHWVIPEVVPESGRNMMRNNGNLALASQTTFPANILRPRESGHHFQMTFLNILTSKKIGVFRL